MKEEGLNFSAGERQLVALCRAVVKGSRVLVLDEATSSVDAGTDAFVKRAILTEFRDQSILCIAHRLATIVSLIASHTLTLECLDDEACM